MRVLLDTHIALWSVKGSPKLSREAVRLIVSADGVFFSSISLVEIAVKHARGPASPDPILVDARQAHAEFRLAGFTELALTAAHAEALDTLPPLHRDPFDRMLIAQAMTEPMRLLTHDAAMTAYGALVAAV
ncbi:type II toxin-antitoxin system VapC family toxin [uncultured Brevundimonas sp.]|uniref:type II toxin-antitoxin system VapC family toxin n=1 Tax=uncultured Brevundimonas sp. TaxID=213418 RepID=UPI00262BDB9F|nr:type II toxin-antitoxin system VapC family toxin [uncultured Brevundimonas sp.]